MSKVMQFLGVAALVAVIACSGGGGSKAPVVAGATITSFVATKAGSPVAAPILYGDTVDLVASFSGGTGAVDHGIGAVNSGSSVTTAALKSNTTFTLSVSAPGATDATKALGVLVQGVSVSNVTPANANINLGETAQFSATVHGALDSTLRWTANAGSIDANGLFTAPIAPQVVIVTAASAADPTVSQSVAINAVGVLKQPVITSMVAANANPLYGGATTLTPVFANGNGTIDQGVGVVTSGASINVGPFNTAKTFTLTVSGVAGTTAAVSQVTITPQAAVVAPIAGPAVALVGSSISFASQVTGASNSALIWAADGGVINSSTGAWTAPTGAGTYHITATSAADASKTQSFTATVVGAPVVSSFAASSLTPLYGATATLLPVFGNGTGSVDQGVGAVTTGSAVTVGPFTSAKTYTLTVSGVQGSTPASASVTVTPQSVSISGVSGPGNLTVGATATYTALVSGAANTGINWSADGGTMDPAAGTWVAPVVPGTYHLKAVSQADSTKTSSLVVSVVGVPAVASFVASSQTPLFGATVSLTGVFSYGTGAIDQGVGAVTSGAPVTVGPFTTAGTFTLTVTGSQGTVPALATVTVTPSAVSVAPVVGATNLLTGGTSSYSSSVSGALNTAIAWSADGGFMDASSGTWVAPATAGTYHVKATSSADPSKSASLAVVVAPNASISSFLASNVSPLYGATVTLTGTFVGTGGSIDHGVGSVTSGSPATVGPLTSPVTYGLTVTGQGASASASVTVTPQAVAVAAISGPASVNSSATATFTSSVSGAVNGGLVWTADLGSINASTGAWVAPATAGTATITATSAADGTKSKSFAVSVLAPTNPSITGFTVANSNPLYGASTSLTATFANGTGVVDQGVGSLATGANAAVGPFTAPKTYTLTVTGAAGTTPATAQATVTPQSVFVVPVTGPASVNANGSATFTSTVSGAVNAGLVWTADLGSINAATGAWVAPATSGTATITATSVADGTKSKSIVVSVIALVNPSITGFTAATSNPLYGASTTLTATFANGTGVVDQGVGSVATGVSAAIGPITSAKTYTLTVTGAAGTTPATAQVTVTPQTVVVAPMTVAFWPVAGMTWTFSTAVTGAVNTAIVWSADAGTINANTGAWVAPATPGLVHITATSAADPTKSQTLPLTLAGQPAITDFSASSLTPLLGGTVTLSATFVNGAGMVSPGGVITSGGSMVVGPFTTPGDHGYSLTVVGASGTTNAQSWVTMTPQTVVVSAIAGPTNVNANYSGSTFNASYTASVSGALNTTLTWSANGGAMDPVSGLWTIPTVPGTYSIHATSVADPTKVGILSVIVGGLTPSVTSFAASNSNPLYGATATVTGVFANGSGAISGPSSGSVNSGDVFAVGAITAPKTYTLTVTGADGTTPATAQVTITPQPIVVAAITGPDIVVKNAVTAFSANVSGAVVTGIDWSVIGVNPGTINPSTGAYTAPNVAGTVTIIATSSADHTTSVQKTITIAPVPSVTTFTASSLNPNFGASVNLNATFPVGLTGTIDQGVGTVTSGVDAATGAILATRNYTLTVSNGLTSTTSMLTVIPKTVAVSSVTGVSIIAAGDTSRYQATVQNAQDTSVTWSASIGSINAGGFFTAPGTLGTMNITATSVADPSKSKTITITVVPVPSITSFTADTTTPAQGASAVLLATFPSGLTGSVDHGVGTVLSGTGFIPMPSGSTTYTLTVTNGLTSVTQALTINPQSLAISAISPATPILATSGSVTFHATVSGGSDNRVYWNCSDGVSIDLLTGVFTPMTTGVITVKAISLMDPSVFSTTTVNVVDVPSVGYFLANPYVTGFGSTSNLSWSVTGNPTTTTLNGGVVAGNGATVTPVNRQSYTLSVSNLAGGASASTTVASRGLNSLAGNPSTLGLVDGQQGTNRLCQGTALAKSGANLLLADNYGTVRSVATNGTVATVAGVYGVPVPIAGPQDDASNPLNSAFGNIKSLVIDAAGNKILSSSLGGLRIITTDGATHTVVPSGFSLPNPGKVLLVGSNGLNPRLAVSNSTNIYWVEVDLTTFLATQPVTGPTLNLGFTIGSMALDQHGDIWVSGTLTNKIYKVSGAYEGTKTQVVAVSSASVPGVLMDGAPGVAVYNYPGEICVAANGADDVLYFCAPLDQTLRTMTITGGTVTYIGTLSGAKQLPVASRDGSAAIARFRGITAMLVDGGTLYVAGSDYGLRAVDRSTGAVTTVAGQIADGGKTDGVGSSATFGQNLYVAAMHGADTGNTLVLDAVSHTLRKVTQGGVVTTLASIDSIDNAVLPLMTPKGLGVTTAGDVFVLMAGTGGGKILCYPGGMNGAYLPLGHALSASPSAIAVAPSGGEVYVLDGMAIYQFTGSGSYVGFASVGSAGNLTADDGGSVYFTTNGRAINFLSNLSGPFLISGSSTEAGYIDGDNTVARYSGISALAIDGINLWVIDGSSVRRLYLPTYAVSTWVGHSISSALKPYGSPAGLGFIAGDLASASAAGSSLCVTTSGDLVAGVGSGLIQITAPPLSPTLVVAAPSVGIQGFTATGSFAWGTNLILTANYTGSVSASVDHGVGSITSGVPVNVPLVITTPGVSAPAPITYTLHTMGSTVSDDRYTTVTPSTAGISINFLPGYETISSIGQTLHLSAAVTGAVSPYDQIDWSISGPGGSGLIVPTGNLSADWTIPSATGTYTVTATSHWITSSSASYSVTVSGATIGSFSGGGFGTDGTYYYSGLGETVGLWCDWSSGTGSLTSTGWSGSKVPTNRSGFTDTTDLQINRDYTLTISVGGTVTDTKTITVKPLSRPFATDPYGDPLVLALPGESLRMVAQWPEGQWDSAGLVKNWNNTVVPGLISGQPFSISMVPYTEADWVAGTVPQNLDMFSLYATRGGSVNAWQSSGVFNQPSATRVVLNSTAMNAKSLFQSNDVRWDSSTSITTPSGVLMITADHGFGTTPVGEVFLVDINGDYSYVGSMPTPHSGGGSVVLPNGVVLVFGGSTLPFGGGATKSVVAIDPVAKTIISVGALPVAVTTPASVVLVDGRVLVCNSTSSSAMIYDPSSKVAALVAAPDSAIGSAFLLPGGNVVALTMDGQTRVYDPTGNAWYNGPTASCGRQDQAISKVGNQLLIVGGLNQDTQPVANAEILDLTNLAAGWLVVPIPMQEGETCRVGCKSVTRQDGKVVIVGGVGIYSNPYTPCVNDLLYDPNTRGFVEQPTRAVDGSGNGYPAVVSSLPGGRLLVQAASGRANAKLWAW